MGSLGGLAGSRTLCRGQNSNHDFVQQALTLEADKTSQVVHLKDLLCAALKNAKSCNHF